MGEFLPYFILPIGSVEDQDETFTCEYQLHDKENIKILK